MLCKPNRTHLPVTSLQPLSIPYILQPRTRGPERLRDVQWLWWDLMAGPGGPGVQVSRTESSTLLIIPDCDSRTPEINQLAEMKTNEDMWLHLEWLFCTLLTPNASWLPLLPPVKLNVVKADVDKGVKSTGLFIPFRKFSCLSQTLYHWLPTQYPLYHSNIGLPLEWDYSGNSLNARLMSIPGETFSELSAQNGNYEDTSPKKQLPNLSKRHISSKTRVLSSEHVAP